MLSQSKIYNIKKQFPILMKYIDNNKLIYLDNASTTQKPYKVLKSINKYYENINSNPRRGIYHIAELTSNAIENSRKHIQKFINAKSSNEIIFTKGTTESINLVASSITNNIKKGDEILISTLEHHSNIVPWQMLCNRTGAKLKIIPIDRYGYLEINKIDFLLSNKTKLVSITQISNVLGIINPIEKIIRKIRYYNNILILVDGAQVPSSLSINVQKLDVDFYVFSSHKMYGPTGIGILYGKEKILEKLDPYQGGGGMIKEVSMKKSLYSELPFKFESGTQNIEGIIAWKAAIEFIENIGINNIKLYEKNLLKYVINKLSNIKDIIIYCYEKSCENYSNIISFNIKNIHPFDVGIILNRLGIAVRTGNHCAQPLMNFLKIKGTVRISLAIYNTYNDIDILYNGILKAKKILLKNKII